MSLSRRIIDVAKLGELRLNSVHVVVCDMSDSGFV